MKKKNVKQVVLHCLKTGQSTITVTFSGEKNPCQDFVEYKTCPVRIQ